MTKSFTKYRFRIRAVSLVIISFWVVLCGKLFSVQILQADENRKKLTAQAHRKESIPAERGNIFDRNGDALTRNVAHYTISVNPSKVKDKVTLAKKLRKITNRPHGYYTKKLDSGKNFEYLERNLKYDISERKLHSINDINIKKNYRRTYPHGSIASQILGYTDTEDKGISGIEKDYNKFLSGTPGQVIKSKGWQGKYQTRSGLPYVPPKDGDNLKLTIDLNYQSILQEELKKRKKETNSISAMGVIMNPQTGAILAMASVPDFDNNYFSKYKINNHHCRAITDQFEPGSTFKIVAAVAALSENKLSLQEEFNCENGKFEYFNQIVKDHEPYGQLTLPQIIKHSSNIGIIKIAERLGSKTIHKYAKLFGFGSSTNVGIRGETSGSLKPYNNWSRISVGQISMGHEVAVSAIQLATAFSAIANGGFLVKPFIVEQIFSPDNKIEKNSKTKFKRKIANQKIMSEVKKMLRQVVSNGTGTEADIAGWEIAGKTGTAQKYIDGKYSDSEFISNFVGFFPSNEPQVLSAIILDEPDTPMHWGGQGAAVAFKRIMNRIINMDDKIRPPEKKQNTFAQNRYNVPTESKESINQIPISLSTKASKKTMKMPNLKGKSLKKAIEIINQMGLKIKIEGSGRVVYQKPTPGTILGPKYICLVQLK